MPNTALLRNSSNHLQKKMEPGLEPIMEIEIAKNGLLFVAAFSVMLSIAASASEAANTWPRSQMTLP